MPEYRRSSHSVYKLHYHFVFATKYRKSELRGPIGQELRDMIRNICRAMDVEILTGHVRPDHVHLHVSMPPRLAPSRFMQAVKGKSSHKLLSDWRKLRAAFWGRHLWARGYFVTTSGNITDEVIADYIKNQGVEPENDAFQVTE